MDERVPLPQKAYKKKREQGTPSFFRGCLCCWFLFYPSNLTSRSNEAASTSRNNSSEESGSKRPR